jgi:hypothetical protein
MNNSLFTARFHVENHKALIAELRKATEDGRIIILARLNQASEDWDEEMKKYNKAAREFNAQRKEGN